MESNKEKVIAQLENFINFIENMEAIIRNPYSAGLKTDELLTDIKQYTNDTIELVKKIEEAAPAELSEPNEKAE